MSFQREMCWASKTKICSLDECNSNGVSTNNTGNAWTGIVAPKSKAPKNNCCIFSNEAWRDSAKRTAAEKSYAAPSQGCMSKRGRRICCGSDIGVSSVLERNRKQVQQAQNPQKQKQELNSPVFTAKTIPEFTEDFPNSLRESE